MKCPKCKQSDGKFTVSDYKRGLAGPRHVASGFVSCTKCDWTEYFNGFALPYERDSRNPRVERLKKSD